MEAAEGAIKLAASKLYPEIAARGALTEQSRGRLFEGIATGAAAGVLWELDLWGRVRAGKAAASETYRSTNSGLRVRKTVAGGGDRAKLVPGEPGI